MLRRQKVISKTEAKWRICAWRKQMKIACSAQTGGLGVLSFVWILCHSLNVERGDFGRKIRASAVARSATADARIFLPLFSKASYHTCTYLLHIVPLLRFHQQMIDGRLAMARASSIHVLLTKKRNRHHTPMAIKTRLKLSNMINLRFVAPHSSQKHAVSRSDFSQKQHR